MHTCTHIYRNTYTEKDIFKLISQESGNVNVLMAFISPMCSMMCRQSKSLISMHCEKRCILNNNKNKDVLSINKMLKSIKN